MGTSLTSGVGGNILASMSDNLAVGSLLLKKTANAEKAMVQELLPPPPPHNGRLDVSA
ncbi:MAG: hypothetical protein NT023_17865 [Armatimonadetes bacterium]|nr:hypothetical protein [Armatimonadota bacterium]